MRIIHRTFFLFCLMVLLLPVALAAAQDQALTLSIRRTWGYGGGSQIQGNFRLSAAGPADLISVTFKLDDQTIATVPAAPFQVDIQTDNYPPGWHVFSASGQTAGGQTLSSNTKRYEFLSSEQAAAAIPRVLGPILGVVVVVALAAFLIPLLIDRVTGNKRASLPAGAARNYGWTGGAVCAHCGRPFAIHWWGLNISLVGKFDRCDYCGHWALVRRMPLDVLRAAEAAEAQAAQPAAPAASPEEKLRQQMDDSRFMDDR